MAAVDDGNDKQAKKGKGMAPKRTLVKSQDTNSNENSSRVLSRESSPRPESQPVPSENSNILELLMTIQKSQAPQTQDIKALSST